MFELNARIFRRKTPVNGDGLLIVFLGVGLFPLLFVWVAVVSSHSPSIV
jgi:hypothetical protein